jgi:Tfp pilus assembly protein PilX
MKNTWNLMKNTDSLAPKKSGGVADRGFALVFTLLLLGMMSLMALAMVLSTSSDMLINGYYRNARGSFYAADSGLNIARQQLENEILAQVPTTWSSPPISNTTTAAQAALNYITTNYGGGSFTPLGSGQSANPWSGQFKITNVSFQLVGTPTVTSYCTSGASCTQPPSNYANKAVCTTANTYIADVTGCSYTFQYSLSSVGAVLGSEQDSVSETGNVIVTASGQGSSTTQSFASFAAFIGSFPTCLGPLVPGYLTGPMFTNGSWQWGNTGTYTLTDYVGQQNADFDFWFGSNCIQSPTASYKSGSQTITPQFQGSPSPGYGLGLGQAPLPQNDFSQQWAVLDGVGTGEPSSAPTAAQMNSGNLTGSGGVPPYPPLQTASGTAYPTTGATSGVYLPYTTSGGVNTFDGGGFYVAGSASITLSTSGTSAEVYAITQTSGSTTTTTTITTDPLATPATSWSCPSGTKGTTVVSTAVTTSGGSGGGHGGHGGGGSGSTTTTSANFCSVPMDVGGSPAQPATMVYVNGTITGLSGTGQGVAGIQNYNAITIAANGDIDITGDLIYATEPVTTSANQVVPGTSPACCNGSPADTLIPGHDNGQVFGLFTANGNIVFSSSYSNDNLEVDGSMAAIANGQNWGFGTNGSINTLTNVGGRIEDEAHSVNMNSFNIYFDRRFVSNSGFAPPWFPSTTITSTGPTTTSSTPSVKRVQWVLNNM